MKQEARTLPPGQFRQLARYLGVALGIADDRKGVRGLFLHRRLEGGGLAHVGRAGGSPRLHPVEVLGLGLKPFEANWR